MRFRTNSQGECPEDKLKFFSYLDELQATRPLFPTTPNRDSKAWVMDAWEDHQDCISASPEKSKYINQLIQNHEVKETKGFRLRKIEVMSQRIEPNLKISTPLRQQKLGQSPQVSIAGSLQKQNKHKEEPCRKQISRLYNANRPVHRQAAPEQEGPFKVPLSSVIYPLIKDPDRRYATDKRRRIDRFHSFVARSVRR